MVRKDMHGRIIPPPPPFETSWAAKVNEPSTMANDIARMKNTPTILQTANLQWFMRKHNVSEDKAYELLGYSRPIATYTAAEYHAMSFRGGGLRQY